MKPANLDLTVHQATTTSVDVKRIFVEMVGVDLNELVEQFTVMELVDAMDKDDVLEAIGKEYAKEYFGLKEA